MIRAVFILLMLGVVASPTYAADAPASSSSKGEPATGKTNSVLGKHDTGQPINIAADKVTADLAAKTVTYSGNVVVSQGDIRMHADAMKVNTDNGKAAQTITANGHVVVDSPASGTATSDAGIYDVPNHLITLTGQHVVLTHNKDISSGTKLTVNLATNIATFVGDKSKGGTGRVQGVFTPTGSN